MATASAASTGRSGWAMPRRVCTIRSIWSLLAPPDARHGLLHLVGRVLDHLAARGDGLGHRDPRRLRHGDGAAHVDLEQHPLDGHDGGPVLLEQGPQVDLQLGQPMRRRQVGGRAQHADGHRPGAGGQLRDEPVAATGEPRVDAEHVHAFDRSPATRGWRGWGATVSRRP